MRQAKIFVFLMLLLFSSQLVFSMLCAKTLHRNDVVLSGAIVTNSEDLLRISHFALDHYDQDSFESRRIEPEISGSETRETLLAITKLLESDEGLSAKSLQDCFDLVRFSTEEQIRLTKYYIPCTDGVSQKTHTHPCALYRILTPVLRRLLHVLQDIEKLWSDLYPQQDGWSDDGELFYVRLRHLAHAEEVNDVAVRLLKAIQSEEFAGLLETFSCPLSLDSIVERCSKLLYLQSKLTKQEIIDGAFEHRRFQDHVEPVVWISRRALEEGLMQGSIFVTLPDQGTALFNVDECNGYRYMRDGRRPEEQRRYWLFREVHQDSGLARDHHTLAIINAPLVVFAGDVDAFGHGKIVLLEYDSPWYGEGEREILIGVIVDKGGAFVENYAQLDLFVGTFETRDLYNQFVERRFPLYTKAYMLKKRA